MHCAVCPPPEWSCECVLRLLPNFCPPQGVWPSCLTPAHKVEIRRSPSSARYCAISDAIHVELSSQSCQFWAYPRSRKSTPQSTHRSAGLQHTSAS